MNTNDQSVAQARPLYVRGPSFWNRYRNALATLLLLAVVGAILQSFMAFNVADLLGALKRFSFIGIATAAVLVSAQILFQCSRFRSVLVLNEKLTWSTVSRTFIFGQVANAFLPARAGDVAKTISIRDASGTCSTSYVSIATQVLIADKLADIFSLALLVAAIRPTWITDIPIEISAPLVWFVLGGLIFTALSVLLIRSFAPRWGSKLRVLVQNVRQGFSVLGNPKRALLSLAFGTAAWVAECYAILTLSHASGYPLSFTQTVSVLVALNLGIAIPVSFANLGTFEAAITVALTQFGVPVSDALAIALVHHLLQLGVLSIAGLVLNGKTIVRKSIDALNWRNPFRVTPEDKMRAVRYYQGKSGHYHKTVERGVLIHLRNRERKSILRFANVEDPALRTMIDVGCGEGFYALAAKRAGLKVTATDICPTMVDLLKDRVDQALVWDVETSGLREHFDLVICAGVLDFVINPDTAFKNLANLVSPEGRLIVQAPRVGLAEWLYRLEKRVMGFRVNLFSLEWFQQRARLSGLELLDHCRPLPTNRVILFSRVKIASSL